MRLTRHAIALCAGLAVAACATGGNDRSGTTDAQPSTPQNATTTARHASRTVSKTTYHCSDGSQVEAWYPTTSTAKIVYQGQRVDMTIAVSASGARYVGGGWQWWTKGMTEGMLSPLAEGESIASASGISCTVP